MTSPNNNISKRLGLLLIVLLLIINTIPLSLALPTAQPDLKISNNPDLPDTIAEGDIISLKIKIKNIGSDPVPSSDSFDISLFLDSYSPSATPIATATITGGLSVDTEKTKTLQWQAVRGSHTLIFYVDHYNAIAESQENNNRKDIPITVTQRPTDIQITKFIVPENPRVRNIYNIYTNVTNHGKTTTKKITAKLTIRKNSAIIQTQTKEIYGLEKNEHYNFSYNWNVTKFGVYTLNMTMSYTTGTDYAQTTTAVHPYRVPWWNTSWHYRQFVETTNQQTISKQMNFTTLLDTLNINTTTFEPETIHIIEYNSEGDIIGEITNYSFNESTAFHPQTNATGVLSWNRTQSSSSHHYYAIYFDVTENPGKRNTLNETPHLNGTTDAILETFTVEGWWPIIHEPHLSSYQLGTLINITIDTTAVASTAEAHIYHEETTQDALLLTPDTNLTHWTYTNYPLDLEGAWTIQINSSDNAGYTPEPPTHTLFVGRPDLSIHTISFSPSTLAEKQNVRVTADIRAANSSVGHVDVSFIINDELHEENTNNEIILNQQNLIMFNWTPPSKGIYKITIIVDPDDTIDEYNETNNRYQINKTVTGLPDISIDKVQAPTTTINEGSTVEIYAIVNNTGHEDATDYVLELFVEKNQMDWIEKRSTTTFSVKQNKTKNITLTWSPAQPGTNWVAGVKISDDQLNLGTGVTQRIANTTFTVTPAEQIKPTISNIDYTQEQEQGKPVSITAKITDASGIANVSINITTPSAKTVTTLMTADDNNVYSYRYTDTARTGTYLFFIIATDNSYHPNTEKSANNTFKITPDQTPPAITYYDAYPNIQTPEERVKISCVATDHIGIKRVHTEITYPDGNTTTKTLMSSDDEEYIVSAVYSTYGRYEFRLIVEDLNGNTATTSEKTFWITSDVDDTDNDGMPDWWETKYGFNPYDPTDADNDFDNDGYTNREEYKSDTNPLEDVAFENMLLLFKDNGGYLLASIALFIAILLISLLGIKRRRYA